MDKEIDINYVKKSVTQIKDWKYIIDANLKDLQYGTISVQSSIIRQELSEHLNNKLEFFKQLLYKRLRSLV